MASAIGLLNFFWSAVRQMIRKGTGRFDRTKTIIKLLNALPLTRYALSTQDHIRPSNLIEIKRIGITSIIKKLLKLEYTLELRTVSKVIRLNFGFHSVFS